MKFRHIKYQDRLVIQEKITQGESYSEIGKAIGKRKSAVYYEIKNKSKGDQYCAEYAQEATVRGKAVANSLRNKYANPRLMLLMRDFLKKGRSPKDIAMRVRKKFADDKSMRISHETIYRIAFTFKNRKTFKYLADLYQYLPRKNKKKHTRGHISPYRVKSRYWRSIHQMHEKFKKSFGTWEIDAMHIKNGYILVCIEVFSKKTMAIPVQNLTAISCLRALRDLFSRIKDVKAMICDRGSENTQYKALQRMLNTRVYACDPGSPWQKGLVEGTIRLFRRYFPKDCDYNRITPKNVYRVCALLNTMYRASLGKKTANEVYYENLKTQDNPA